jgi:hypothetical protein
MEHQAVIDVSLELSKPQVYNCLMRAALPDDIGSYSYARTSYSNGACSDEYGDSTLSR